MTQRFDDRFDRPIDPAAAGAGVDPGEAELDDLLDAWYRERSRRIESTLLLHQARKLLLAIAREADLPERRDLQLRRLLRAIRDLDRRQDQD